MRKRWIAALMVIVALALLLSWQTDFLESNGRQVARKQGPLEEHVYGGLPGDGPVLVRKGFVLSYDPVRRVPSWVAYHIRPDYLNRPGRKGKYATFRSDPAVDDPVVTRDYTGSGFHRGHLAPFYAMGGDRDGDGDYASDGDPEDSETIFEANRMSNIVPQHARFNGSGGLWYALETWVREEVVRKRGREVWVFAGCIFGPGEHQKIGPRGDIWVPPMFYKIVIFQGEGERAPKVLAFLFPHQSVSHKHQRERIFPYFLVSVDVIEVLTGLDFFPQLEAAAEFEAVDTWRNWRGFLAGPS